MTQESFRGVVAAVLVVILAAGLYLGWHFTHPAHHPCVVNGQVWQGHVC